MDSDLDFYELLGISAAAGRADVETALSRCQAAWSLGTRNPKTRHTFQSYLDLIPTLRQALLSEPSARAEYDAQLAARKREERDRRRAELERFVKLRAAKGGLTPSDHAVLNTEAIKRGLMQADLDGLTLMIPRLEEPPPEHESDEADPPRDVLDPAVRRQIRLSLEHLKKTDLYDVLQLPQTASAEDIAVRSDALRARWMQKTQVTAEKTAWMEAVSYAQTHLLTGESRLRYDQTLAQEAEDKCREIIAFALGGLRRLDSKTLELLLEEARTLGIALARAERLVVRACKEFGVSLEKASDVGVSAVNDFGTSVGDASVPKDAATLGGDGDGGGHGGMTGSAKLMSSVRQAWRQFSGGGLGGLGGRATVRERSCRACGQELGARFASMRDVTCPHCQAEVRWTCPNCRELVWLDQPACGCGFPQAGREPFQRALAAGQLAYKTRDYAAALSHLERARELAPKHDAARRAVRQVKQRMEEVELAREAFEDERAQGRLIAARECLDHWARLIEPLNPEAESARTDLAKIIRQAKALAAQGRNRMDTDTDAAIALFRQALKLVADLPEAVEGLKRCPPEAPSDLIVVMGHEKVLLRWSAPPQDGLGAVQYRVVRKRHGLPAHAGDGVIVTLTSDAEAEDSHIQGGDRVGYAVFSQRGEAVSRTAALFGPAHIAADVSGVRVETSPGEARLSWVNPGAASGVQLVRKIGGPPKGPTDGDVITHQRDHAIDVGLSEDVIYYYSVFALYPGETPGKIRASRGVTVTAWAQGLTSGLGVLHWKLWQETQFGSDGPGVSGNVASVANAALRLSWTAPKKGQVRVLKTDGPLNLPAGTTVTSVVAQSWKGTWLPANAPDMTTDNDPPTTGVCRYTAFLVWSGHYAVGPCTAYARLLDPTDLKVTHLGTAGRVQVRWTWGAPGTDTLLTYRAGVMPEGPRDPLAGSVLVKELEYYRQGHFALGLPGYSNTIWHFRAYGVMTIDGEALHSPGVAPGSRAELSGPPRDVTVRYRVEAGWLRRGLKIVFQTDPPGMTLPPTILVANARALPLTADDGTVIDRFPGAKDGQSFPVRAELDGKKQHLRLFLDPAADPEGLAHIHIKPPQDGASRI